MVEWDCVPKPVRSFYIVPLDKAGKDPRKCANKRPIALLSPMMKLLELILVRRLLPKLEGKLAEEQYAYQKARSTELLLEDLDRFVRKGKQEGWITYMVGMDVAGAFDSASLPRLVETLRYYAIPDILCRFIGTWLTERTFTIKMSTPEGTVMGKQCRPTRGVPQGGVLSPLLWILHVNRVAEETLKKLRKKTSLPNSEWRIIFQVFADDISAAVSHRTRRGVITLSKELSEALLEVLKKLDLEVAKPKCNNFLIEGMKGEEKTAAKRDKNKSRLQKKEKERKRLTMRKALDRLQNQKKGGAENKEEELPFNWVQSFKLLGVILDNEWKFDQHREEAKAKARKRFVVLTKVGNAVWGMESRILSVTAHSLVESVVSYGLATTGKGWDESGAEQLDRAVLNKTARKVVGTNQTMRLEILMILADMRSTWNHYIIKTANILDRILRASGTTARRSAILSIREKFEEWEEEGDAEELPETTEISNRSSKRGKQGSEKEQNQDKGRYARQEEKELIWETMKRKMKRKKDVEVQNSIYYTSEATIKEEEHRKRIVFQKLKKEQGYDTALSILSRIRWDPGITYKEEIYPDLGGINIRWGKIWWGQEKEKEGNEEEGQDKKTGTIEVFSIPIWNAEYVLGTTTITRRGESTQKKWCHILGARFSNDPTNQAGVNLTVSLDKTAKWIEKEYEERQEGITIKVHTEYGQDFATEQKKRWRTYGTTTKPIPGQKTLNRILSKLTNNRIIKEIILIRPTKKLKKKIESAINEQLKDSEVGKILGPERINMAGFWATQEEVKKALKEANEVDEQPVVQHLANRKGQMESKSCTMCRNWDLDRNRVKKIMAHLAEDRALQTNFANLVGATRFKAGAKGKIWHTICPKCKDNIDSWEHCAKCYRLEAQAPVNEKQWLANIKEILVKTQTDTPAKYMASDKQHEHYAEEEKGRGKIRSQQVKRTEKDRAEVEKGEMTQEQKNGTDADGKKRRRL